jgi:hypothetical protein
MNIFFAIVNVIPLIRMNLNLLGFQDIILVKLFGVPAVFVLKFFGELLMIFLFSALISIIFRINKFTRGQN